LVADFEGGTVFENRVLRRIFGSKRDELTGEWRKLYEELHHLYCSPRTGREA
jgi:PAS domain-containing protein